MIKFRWSFYCPVHEQRDMSISCCSPCLLERPKKFISPPDRMGRPDRMPNINYYLTTAWLDSDMFTCDQISPSVWVHLKTTQCHLNSSLRTIRHTRVRRQQCNNIQFTHRGGTDHIGEPYYSPSEQMFTSATERNSPLVSSN